MFDYHVRVISSFMTSFCMTNFIHRNYQWRLRTVKHKLVEVFGTWVEILRGDAWSAAGSSAPLEFIFCRCHSKLTVSVSKRLDFKTASVDARLFPSLLFLFLAQLFTTPVSATGDFYLWRLHKNRTVRLMKPQNKELSRGSFFKGTYGNSFSRKTHFSFFIGLGNWGDKLWDFAVQSSVVSSCDDWSLPTNTTANSINTAAVSAPSTPLSASVCYVIFDYAQISINRNSR